MGNISCNTKLIVCAVVVPVYIIVVSCARCRDSNGGTTRRAQVIGVPGSDKWLLSKKAGAATCKPYHEKRKRKTECGRMEKREYALHENCIKKRNVRSDELKWWLQNSGVSRQNEVHARCIKVRLCCI